MPYEHNDNLIPDDDPTPREPSYGQNPYDLIELAYRENLLFIQVNPVSQSFDIEHLKEIHRVIFTLPPDLEGLGTETFYPGQFREAMSAQDVAEGRVWQKNRPYPTLRPNEDTVRVLYSNMDEAAISDLNETLKSIDFLGMSQMDQMEFTDEFAQLYAKLDYAHPFMDGNSRTLREFTRQLAQSVGFDVHWEVFGTDSKSMETLYAARDLAVADVGFDRSGDNILDKIPFQETKYDLRAFAPLEVLMRADGFITKSVPAEAEKWTSKVDSSVLRHDPFSDAPPPSRSRTVPIPPDFPVDSYSPRRKV